MKSSQKLKPILIDLDIGDQLTSISCGHIIVELIKFIAYQRLQIPYTYQWLKHVINKKKSCEQDEEIKDSFQSERHYRAASTALENLDFILKSLLQEINGPSLPEEVCIALGATPVTCKEVYRLLLPKACHKPQCHSNFIASDQKVQRNVFRTLVTSENLSKVFYNTLSPTNMYVFLKKKILDNQDSIVCSDNFQITSGCRIPRNSKIVVVDFKTQNLNNITCCNDFQIFGDIINQKLEQCHIENDDQDGDSNQYSEIESSNEFRWYQSSFVMKGFKDCIVNGSSVVNTWLDS